MAKFEKVSRFNDIDLPLPVRKTAESAGYDLVVAEDVIVPPYFDLYNRMQEQHMSIAPTLEETAAAVKKANAKVTLVSTGMKCQLESGTYLELSVRSSCPLKHWLVLANAVGIVDADYYNNPDNEGEIFFQLINLSPWPIQLKRGDAIGQGIIKPYLITKDDNATGERTGGFGSTDQKEKQEKIIKMLSDLGVTIYNSYGNTKSSSEIAGEVTQKFRNLDLTQKKLFVDAFCGNPNKANTDLLPLVELTLFLKQYLGEE